MKNKHTSGPWTVDEIDGGYLIGADKINGTHIAEAMSLPDARIIAAAPELLEAVKVSLEFLDGQNMPKNIQEQISFKNHQREILTKVIAKAEGK